MESIWDRKLSRRDLLRGALQKGLAVAAGGLSMACSTEQLYVLPAKKVEGGTAKLTFKGKNDGSEGKYERTFNQDALRSPQIIDDFDLPGPPGSDKRLNLNFSPDYLQQSTYIFAQIFTRDSNPSSMFTKSLQADLSKPHTLVITWKSYLLSEVVIWDGCPNPGVSPCNAVALSVK